MASRSSRSRSARTAPWARARAAPRRGPTSRGGTRPARSGRRRGDRRARAPAPSARQSRLARPRRRGRRRWPPGPATSPRRRPSPGAWPPPGACTPRGAARRSTRSPRCTGPRRRDSSRRRPKRVDPQDGGGGGPRELALVRHERPPSVGADHSTGGRDAHLAACPHTPGACHQGPSMTRETSLRVTTAGLRTRTRTVMTRHPGPGYRAPRITAHTRACRIGRHCGGMEAAMRWAFSVTFEVVAMLGLLLAGLANLRTGARLGDLGRLERRARLRLAGHPGSSVADGGWHRLRGPDRWPEGRAPRRRWIVRGRERRAFGPLTGRAWALRPPQPEPPGADGRAHGLCALIPFLRRRDGPVREEAQWSQWRSRTRRIRRRQRDR